MFRKASQTMLNYFKLRSKHGLERASPRWGIR